MSWDNSWWQAMDACAVAFLIADFSGDLLIPSQSRRDAADE
jgi:hypothetical protein